jgi:microcystin degradation protein MlrC
MGRILDSLRAAGNVYGVFLRLHGAMYAEGIGPAESVLVNEIRQILGPAVPIACTFDLHGNIPAWLAGSGDILVGLKTAPHTDVAETARLAGRLLLETLKGKMRPVSYVLPIPMIVQGEKAMTTAEPFRALVEEARRIEREGIPGHSERILAATLFVGCAWTDSIDTGMSVVVTADRSRPAARTAAIHLAQRIWDARHQFAFGCESADLEKAISMALEAKETTVFLTDSGDNVTAGTPGDMPLVLRALVERKVKNAVVAGINDKQALARCIGAGEGKTLKLSIGATIEKRFGPPLETEAQVIRLITGDQPSAVIRVEEVEAILTDGPAGFTSLRHFQSCGIDPLSRRIVVVKQGYLFPDLRSIAPRHIMLLTPGAGDMRIEQLTYIRRRKPVFPFEKDATFNPATAPV